MSLIFETFQTEGIAELSYLVGDDSSHTCAVFDPTTDVEQYLDLAREKGLSITHIFETHIHADLVSGARELQARAPGSKIYVSIEGGAHYGFPHEGIRDGERFEFGSTVVTVKHTPGHTPEHVAYLLSEKEIWGVITGDSLFVNSAGRPDLLGDDQTEKLAKQQFHTLRDFFLKLPDHVIIYPAHGHGSPCGADIGDRLTSTIGYERKHNAFLQFDDLDRFIDHALKTAPPVPHYYPRMKKVNADGPEILRNLPPIPALTPQEFGKAEGVVIDTRDMLAFGGGHIEGALNIGGKPMLSIWAGWMLDPEQPILLVAEESKLEQVQRLFVRTGYTRFAGYLAGGMKAWMTAGLPMQTTHQMTVHELERKLDEVQVVDVRAPSEWENGHIPTAHHIFLPELPEKHTQLERDKPVAVYCDSGYRASLGSSILQQKGFRRVSNVPGSWQAWRKR